MLDLEDARARIVSLISPLPSETSPLLEALGRVAATRIRASVPLPPFDNSAMDGYALRAADVREATHDRPVLLRCAATIPAGARASTTVAPGTCARIFTGAPLPQGADAVVMQEDTQRADDEIHVLESVAPWENVRLVGEDTQQGATVLELGQKVTAGRISLLGATGVNQIPVVRKPTVGVLVTGNELTTGCTLLPGQIYESNGNTVAALLTQAGASPRLYPLVGDSLTDTRVALETALSECDCVVTTGGVSVGEHDLVKAAFESIGGMVEFWRIAMKPGKPFLFGQWNGKFLFGLPGNPVSAFVTCLLLVCPAVNKFLGATQPFLAEQTGTLGENVTNHGERRHFMRVIIDPRGVVSSAGLQASHALSSLANANALLPVPAQSEWIAGRQVSVLRWEL